MGLLIWALIFFLAAILLGVLGFGVLSSVAATIAKLLFVIFIVLFIIFLLRHLTRKKRRGNEIIAEIP
jgi:uncharacterized membrane protein YtjA (UPF0391 family)